MHVQYYYFYNILVIRLKKGKIYQQVKLCWAFLKSKKKKQILHFLETIAQINEWGVPYISSFPPPKKIRKPDLVY